MKKIFITSLVSLSFVLTNAQNTGAEIYKPERERINALIHTKLDVKLNFEDQTLDGKEWITLSPYFYPTDSLTLDANHMIIKNVDLVKNGKNIPLKYDYKNNVIKIKLDKEYTKDEEYKVFIQYTAQPNKIANEGGKAITDDKGLYYINADGSIPNKPVQAWTQGETQQSSSWFPTIDSPNQKTSEEISITVPEKFVTLSNGTLTSKVNNGDGTRTDNWRQTQKHAPYLFFMGVGDFAVVEDSWKGRPVNYYVEHEYEDVAKDIFGLTPEMISFYSERFGYEFPWDKYSQIAIRDFVSGAMENTTAVSHMERSQQKKGQLVDQNIWENVIAHELAHHWFGDLVTTESWPNLTVNESFANYSEYLWLEHKYGKDYADAHRLEDLQGYLSGNNFDKNLVRFNIHSNDEMFDAVTYNKGGYILHMLRSYLGDDAFFESLKYYLNTHEFGKAEAQELRLAFEHVSGKDLNWFFNQWYYGNGHPIITVVEEDKPGQVVVNLKQDQPNLFEFPLTIDVYENGVATRHNVWVKKQKINTFTFDVKNKADLVVLDAINDIVAEFKETKTPDQYANQYLWSKDEFQTRYNAIQKLGYSQLNNKNALNALIKALDDPFYTIRIEAIKSLDTTDDIVRQKVEEKLVNIAKKDKKTLVKAEALKKLATIDNEKKYLQLFKDALHTESFSVQGAALEYLSAKAPEEINVTPDELDIKVVVNSPKLLEQLIPEWRKENKIEYFSDLNEMAALFAFMPFQKPEYTDAAKAAFDWILSTNDLGSTKAIAKIYQQYHQFMKEHQPEAIPFLQKMAEKALALKTQTYNEYPNDNLKKQVDILQETVDELAK